ncbi:MAG: alkaline phosphatase [Chitinivibrionales bacterium]|nr:alkaline phosphatase [Chitinivibrionales bacterium]
MKPAMRDDCAMTPCPVLRAVCWMLLCFGAVALAKNPILTPSDVPLLGEMDLYLLSTLWVGDDDTNASLGSICDRPDYRRIVQRWDLRLFGGPMLGNMTDSSVQIWLRTPYEAQVAIAFADNPALSEPIRLPVQRTCKDSDLVAVFTLADLSPNTTYHYEVFVDKKPVFGTELPAFRTYPPKGQQQSILVGFGGGARYIHEHEHVWDAIDRHRLNAFLFLGDNVYHDEPYLRRRQRVHLYRRQLRPELRRLVSSTPIYAIWDDHDFCGDDCGGGPDPVVTGYRERRWKVPTWRVFRQNWVNPSYGGGDGVYGVWFDFSIGAVDFFMLDCRYYRDVVAASAFGPGESMLGAAQKRWLKQRLRASRAVFKVIVSSVPWAYDAHPGGFDHWNGFREEREELFTFIEANGINGVILLSGDSHRHDVWKIDRITGYDFYEFESSRLTNEHSDGCVDDSECLRCHQGRGFGLLRFDFRKKMPTVTYEVRSDRDVRQLSFAVTRDELGAMDTPEQRAGVRGQPAPNAIPGAKKAVAVAFANIRGQIVAVIQHSPACLGEGTVRSRFRRGFAPGVYVPYNEIERHSDYAPAPGLRVINSVR